MKKLRRMEMETVLQAVFVLLFQRRVRLYSWSVRDCRHSFSGASDCCQCCTHARTCTQCTERFWGMKEIFNANNEDWPFTRSRGWPVGVREADESELLCAVQDQVLGHLTGVGQTQRGPEQELRWGNSPVNTAFVHFLNTLIIYACDRSEHAPTKSLWPVASMLLTLISSKSSSMWKRGIVKRVTRMHLNVQQDKRDLLSSSRTFTQQLPVNVKGCSGNGPAVRKKNPFDITSDQRAWPLCARSLPAKR